MNAKYCNSRLDIPPRTQGRLIHASPMDNFLRRFVFVLAVFFVLCVGAFLRGSRRGGWLLLVATEGCCSRMVLLSRWSCYQRCSWCVRVTSCPHFTLVAAPGFQRSCCRLWWPSTRPRLGRITRYGTMVHYPRVADTHRSRGCCTYTCTYTSLRDREIAPAACFAYPSALTTIPLDAVAGLFRPVHVYLWDCHRSIPFHWRTRHFW
jgi:hypothetical protein